MSGIMKRRSSIDNDGSSTTVAKASSDSDRDKAEVVIAATAGRDNWQTWAGRNHGTEDFEYLDVFRGIKRTIHNNLRTKYPKPGTPCPICFCEPDPDESSSSFWHVTWCGHAVCRDCLGQYAINQVGDREQTGPLKCPVCLKTLRKQDAVVAMMAGKHNAQSKDLIKQWDVKMRDQLLRAIPNFRSCPKCGGGGSSGGDTTTANDAATNGGVRHNSVGGGFVTPECLGPHHQERREQAIQILLTRNYAYSAIVLMYFLLVGTIVLTESPSPQLDLFSMLLPIYVFVRIGMAVNYLLATQAREALFRSISVECPCCDESFVLPAESEQFNDEETSKWIDSNTRKCPSCSVPISKTGGCNHVRCSHCGASFCWACMRLSTVCQAYKCQNGAPYRNASFLEEFRDEQPRLQTLQSDGSVLTYIDHILNHRVCPELNNGDGLLVLASLVARHFRLVQFLEREIFLPFLVALLRKIDVFISVFFVLGLGFLAIPTRWANQLRQLLPHGLLPVERFHIEPAQRRQLSQSALFILFVSFFSFPVGLSMGVGFFVNEILPILQQQGQPGFPEREQGAGGPDGPVIVDNFDQTMLNEALRRSIEDT